MPGPPLKWTLVKSEEGERPEVLTDLAHLSVTKLFRLVPGFLAISFPRQSCFHPAFLARFQIEGMSLNFFDNVLLLNFAFEPAQCIFKRFAVLKSYFSQISNTPISL